MPGGACLPLHACAALAIAHAGDSCTQAQANRPLPPAPPPQASYARNCRLLAAFQAVKNVRVRYSGKAALSDGLELDEQRPRFNLNSRIKKAAFKVGRSTQSSGYGVAVRAAGGPTASRSWGGTLLQSGSPLDLP